ncbi:hypothetical protein BCV72DRAFT_67711 [Rhizopus microsporus var. microsporus]|uniref:Uncharacterized protein n=1 Tax=Rhizopus microsporus var. microsporus TaxID=86635 RepID=A0A1X0QPP5_RHIZD|nr:hypothetical protein BCV72DRAFT_67711 [Rhizopus microsporus var. microsporus]
MFSPIIGCPVVNLGSLANPSYIYLSSATVTLSFLASQDPNSSFSILNKMSTFAQTAFPCLLLCVSGYLFAFLASTTATLPRPPSLTRIRRSLKTL